MERRSVLEPSLGLGSFVFSVLTGLFYNRLPEKYKVIGIIVIVAALTIFIFCFYLYFYKTRIKKLRRYKKVLTSLNKNLDRGTIYKGKIRQVQVRLETFHNLLDFFQETCPDLPDEAIKNAGKLVGSSFMKDFQDILVFEGVKPKDKHEKLEWWSLYDADAGFGVLDFSELKDGIREKRTVRLKNSFLASTRPVGSNCLCAWMAGYIEAGLQAMYDQNIVVEALCCDSNHSECQFSVQPT